MHVGLGKGLKTSFGDGDGIGSIFQVRNGEQTGLIGLGGVGNVGGAVGDRNVCIGDYGPGCILCRARDGARPDLGISGGSKRVPRQRNAAATRRFWNMTSNCEIGSETLIESPGAEPIFFFEFHKRREP